MSHADDPTTTTTTSNTQGNDSAAVDWTVREGTTVLTSDGEKIGEVESANGGYLLVKKGFLFPKEYAIPASAIQNVGPDAVYLNVTREIALAQGWDKPLSPEDSQPLPTSTTTTPTSSPQVVTGEPDVTAPLIGTFADPASGTESISEVHDEARDARDDAVPVSALSPAGEGADAEQAIANPIRTGAVPAETGGAQHESPAEDRADIALAEHDETLDDAFDSPHSFFHHSPLPAMNAPLPDDDASDDPNDQQSGKVLDANEIATDAAVADEAINPGLSRNTPEEAESEL